MLHKRKILICLSLLLSFVICFTACTEEAKENTPTETDPTTTVASSDEPLPSATESTTPTLTETAEVSTVNNEPAPTETVPQRVTADQQEDYIPEGEVTANVVDALSETYTIDQVVYSHKLPHIDLPGPNVEAINAEILRDYNTDFYKANYTNLYYHWAVKDDILSVVIIGGGSMFDGGWEGYGCDAFSVYNISVSKCRLLSDQGVYSALGIEDAKSTVLNAIVRYGAEWKGRDAEGKKLFFSDPSNTAEIASIAEELTDESFRTARPYLDEKGNLCAMGYVVTNIGSGGFYGFVPVYQYEDGSLLSAEEYYNYYYTLFSE